MTTDVLVMPKSPIQGPDGQLNSAGFSLFAKLVDRNSHAPANTGAKLLAGGKGNVTAEAIWSVMQSEPTLGGGNWQPDLGERLHFKRTISGASTILFPANVPNDAEVYFSVWVKQDSVGGHSLDMGAGFIGQVPVTLTGAGDLTLLGFNIFSTSPALFTGWAVKAIPAALQ